MAGKYLGLNSYNGGICFQYHSALSHSVTLNDGFIYSISTLATLISRSRS